jgi:hypothetical protein
MGVLGQKWLIYGLGLLMGASLGGCYGALHNQLSFSLAPEYFSAFKFNQFDVPWAYSQPRLGAAWVGVLASWWMGLIVAAALGLVALRAHSARLMARLLAQSFGLVMLVALAVGLWGLWSGVQQVTPTTIAHYRNWLAAGVTDPVAFVRVGFMHNAGYAGGVLGLVVGLVHVLWRTRK